MIRNCGASAILRSWRAVAESFLVVYPVKKHGPGILANSTLVTPLVIPFGKMICFAIPALYGLRLLC
jgi:hypothetical protein